MARLSNWMGEHGRIGGGGMAGLPPPPGSATEHWHRTPADLHWAAHYVVNVRWLAFNYMQIVLIASSWRREYKMSDSEEDLALFIHLFFHSFIYFTEHKQYNMNWTSIKSEKSVL